MEQVLNNNLPIQLQGYYRAAVIDNQHSILMHQLDTSAHYFIFNILYNLITRVTVLGFLPIVAKCKI